jgi:hypothetical protein
MRLTLLVALLLPALANGGFERWEVGGRPAAFGNAYVAVADDPWAVAFNPAGLALAAAPSVALFFSPRPFDLPELSTSALSAVFPSRTGTIGAGVRRYGFALYRETSLSLAAAREARGILLGISLTCHLVSISGYGSSGTLGLDIGLLLPLGEGWRWGACLKNVNAPTVGASDERVPQCITTGIGYHPDSLFTFALDLRKEPSLPLEPRLGLEYRPVEAFALRGGWSGGSGELSAGVGWRWGTVEFDYAFLSHHQLGGTHVASITIAAR